MDNMELWEKVKRPPETVLREIRGGRLSGKTDINPQWRVEELTKQFGPCGTGWKYEITRTWWGPEIENQICGFAEIHLYYKIADKWSDPIPGIGGSMLATKEKNGIYVSDEVLKMAVTDAISVACKMLGFGADIYYGMSNGSKYLKQTKQTSFKPDPIGEDVPLGNGPTPLKKKSDFEIALDTMKAGWIKKYGEESWKDAIGACGYENEESIINATREEQVTFYKAMVEKEKENAEIME
jgi:hypothetical protein